MAQKIHKCTSCSQYTMGDICISCGSKAIIPRPPKFSLTDKYANYRRKTRTKELIEKGLI